MGNTLYNVFPEQQLYPEQWQMIRMHEYPQIMNSYTISTYGRVYDCCRNRIIAPISPMNRNKYINATLRLLDGGKRTFDIHRLMLITFCPTEFYKELVCNHIDGIKCHNWIWNLEWTTTAGNANHAIENGLIRMGADRANGIAPDSLIREVCQMIQDGYSTYDIINTIKPPVDIDMSKLVNNIKNGHCHTNISKQYDFSNAWDVNYDNRRFTIEQVNIICGLFQTYGADISSKYICGVLGIDYKALPAYMRKRYTVAISSIRKKKIYKEICNNYNY